MTHDPNEQNQGDALLRARFADLKRHDRRHEAARPFEAMWRSPPARSSMRVIVPVVSALAAAAVFIVYCGVSSLSSPQRPTASGADGTTSGADVRGGEAPAVAARLYEPLPLDFLLDTSSTSTARPSRGPLHGW